jgi:23S rRNA (uracil1939-C5)-methyltransferase
VQLTIERLGHEGDGVAAGPVFVPRTLPGEVVEAEPAAGRSMDVRVVTPSPHRVAPPCPHYRACGGCSVMHASDDFVAAWKTDLVRQALAAQGLPAPITALHTSPPASRRRAVLAGRRTRSGALVGFHGRASATIIDVPGCQVLRPEIVAAQDALAEVTGLAASRSAEVSLAVTVTDSGLDLAVTGAKPFEARTMAARLASLGFARVTWNGERAVETSAPVVRIGRALVPLPPGAFLQATAEGQAALTDAVRRAAGPARRVADLFAGLGTFTLPLSETAEVHAVESDATMLAALDLGWRRASGLHRVVTEPRDLFRRPLDSGELARLDAVVIDPPRAGALAQTQRLAEARPPVVAAVSCNPATFARDARVMVDAGYQVEWIEVIDQFRWSAHVELAARLVAR